MKVKLSKVTEGSWVIESEGTKLGTCRLSNKYHGSYEAKLKNGLVLNAFSQKSLIEMVRRNTEEI